MTKFTQSSTSKVLPDIVTCMHTRSWGVGGGEMKASGESHVILISEN